ncbi:MAG TPA: hypothetical protein VGH23_10845 [Rhizomicrobium sp.]
MPRYYFEIDDGRRKIADEEGSDLLDRQQAREEGVNLVLEFAREGLLDGDQRALLCKVRDETALILTVSLSLSAEWNNSQNDLGG